MEKVKTIFLGSGEFAVPVLECLLNLEFIDLQCVVTQPDKPVGRKQELEPTEVGKYASSKNIELIKSEKIRAEAQAILDKYQPELIIVASYGQIIPNVMLDYPKYKCLNLHGSVLPKLRGAVPVQMAILNGFETTGVTLQVMAPAMDVGAIVATLETSIDKEETSEGLMSKLAKLAVKILENDLQKWINGDIKPVEQIEENATYCYKEDLSKEKAEIRYETDVNLAERMIRAFYPWPIAWIRMHDGKTLKIYKARFDDLLSQNVSDFHKLNKHENVPFIMRADKNLYLVLNNGVLELNEIQLEGKNRRAASEYFFLAN